MKKTIAAGILLLLSAVPMFAQCKVNVNAASQEQVQYLIRTGPVLATRIIEARPIKDAEALDAIKGVGEAWMRDNGKHITFEGPTTCDAKQKAPKKENTEQ